MLVGGVGRLGILPCLASVVRLMRMEKFHGGLDLGVGVGDGGRGDAEAVPGEDCIAGGGGGVDIGVLVVVGAAGKIEVPVGSVEAQAVGSQV